MIAGDNCSHSPRSLRDRSRDWESCAKSCEAVGRMGSRRFEFSGPFAARKALSHAMKAIVTTVTVTDLRQPLWMSSLQKYHATAYRF